MDIRDFLEIEKKYSLYMKNINGINYWNYSRVQLWNFEICAQKLDLQETHPMKKHNLTEKMQTAISLIKHFLLRGKTNFQTDVLFLAHERRVKIDGIYKCIYTEPIAELFPDSMLLDMPYEYRHLKPESKSKRYYIDYIMIVGNLYYQMHKCFNTKYYKLTLSHIREQMEQPIKEILESYQISSSREKIYRILHRKLLIVECELKLYDRLLSRLSPKVIVEVVYYGMGAMIINELAKRRNIPTIELQHGTMHRNHAAYQFLGKETVPQFPDKIFLFSDFWKKQVNVPIPNSNMMVMGFPYFEENRNRYITYKKVKTKKTILFVSQGTIGYKLSKFAVEVADKLLPQGYKVMYKLHPAEVSAWERNYSYLKNTGIKVISGEDKNIYECFAESDVQVGVYSTAIYEGLGFGLRTFIYNIGHADTLYELVNEGYAQIVNNSEELIKLLKEEKEVRKGDKFWSVDALYKIETQLKKILNESNNRMRCEAKE